jgi:hypothetical protein
MQIIVLYQIHYSSLEQLSRKLEGRYENGFSGGFCNGDCAQDALTIDYCGGRMGEILI